VRFSTWNVRSLYRADALMTNAKEVSKYELDLVGVEKTGRTGLDPFLWKGE
jgi:hypothetical protein